MIDLTRLQKLIHDYEIVAGEKPQQLLMSEYMRGELNKLAEAANERTPVCSFMNVQIRTSPIVPKHNIYIGKILPESDE